MIIEDVSKVVLGYTELYSKLGTVNVPSVLHHDFNKLENYLVNKDRTDDEDILLSAVRIHNIAQRDKYALNLEVIRQADLIINKML